MSLEILVAYDYGPTSEAALAWASNLLRAARGTLTVAHVVPQAPIPAAPEGVTMGMYPTASDLERAREVLRDTVSRAHPGARVEVRSGTNVGAAVLACAAERHANLLVSGTHGRSPVARTLLGSVADYLVRHADCPVVTIRHGAAAQAVLAEERRRESGEPGGGKGRADEVARKGIFPYSVTPHPADAERELRTPASLTPHAPYDESGRSGLSVTHGQLVGAEPPPARGAAGPSPSKPR